MILLIWIIVFSISMLMLWPVYRAMSLEAQRIQDMAEAEDELLDRIFGIPEGFHEWCDEVGL